MLALSGGALGIPFFVARATIRGLVAPPLGFTHLRIFACAKRLRSGLQPAYHAAASRQYGGNGRDVNYFGSRLFK